MRLKKKLIPSYDLELSDVEATAALHMARAATGVIISKGSLTAYDKAALALAKSLETLLMKQGAKNKLATIEETYKGQMSPRKTPSPPTEPEKQAEEGEDFQKQLEELLEEDEDVI